MSSTYQPAEVPTMYFIGVTTGKSSIMRVFPAWMSELGMDAVIRGIDFEPRSAASAYREAVQFIKEDRLSLGALVTTHKLPLLAASRDLFDALDPFADLLSEVSSISKRQDRLVGHAKDPISSGLAVEAIAPAGHWEASGGELLLLGAGGSSLALTLYLHNKQRGGGEVPAKIHVTNRSQQRLDEMRNVHSRVGFAVPTEYYLAPEASLNDEVVSGLPAGSMVVNATGLGKDGPGSPLTDAAVFPDHGLVWEFNYRGDLVFLDQARAQEGGRSLTVVDGWEYFIHGWTQVIAEVFDQEIPSSGPSFERLSEVAAEAAKP